MAEAIQSRLKIEPGGTTEDRLFTFQPVNCLGACALAPVMVIDEKYYGKVTPDQVPEILAEYAAKEETVIAATERLLNSPADLARLREEVLPRAASRPGR